MNNMQFFRSIPNYDPEQFKDCSIKRFAVSAACMLPLLLAIYCTIAVSNRGNELDNTSKGLMISGSVLGFLICTLVTGCVIKDMVQDDEERQNLAPRV